MTVENLTDEYTILVGDLRDKGILISNTKICSLIALLIHFSVCVCCVKLGK
jgi:hypothetical protein